MQTGTATVTVLAYEVATSGMVHLDLDDVLVRTRCHLSMAQGEMVLRAAGELERS